MSVEAIDQAKVATFSIRLASVTNRMRRTIREPVDDCPAKSRPACMRRAVFARARVVIPVLMRAPRTVEGSLAATVGALVWTKACVVVVEDIVLLVPAELPTGVDEEMVGVWGDMTFFPSGTVILSGESSSVEEDKGDSDPSKGV